MPCGYEKRNYNDASDDQLLVFDSFGGICFAAAAADVWRQRQKRAVMNVVWPITAVSFGPLLGWSYDRWDRQKYSRPEDKKKVNRPSGQKVWVGDTHCSAGCTPGDILAEWAVFRTGFTRLGSSLWSSCLGNFVLADRLVAPLRKMAGCPAVGAATKADTISLTAFAVGLWAFMASMHAAFPPPWEPSGPRYWFLMQVGMSIRLWTTFPAKGWLLRQGWKEAM